MEIEKEIILNIKLSKKEAEEIIKGVENSYQPSSCNKYPALLLLKDKLVLTLTN
jgi:hypothetical protein